MKKIFFVLFVLFVVFFFTGCASNPAPAYIGSSNSNNDAIPFVQQKEPTTYQQQPIVTQFNIIEEKTVPAQPAQINAEGLEKRVSSLEEGVSGLEKRVGEHGLILEKHSGEISGIKARLAHNYQVLADVNRRATRLENEIHLGKELKQVEVNFKIGSSELSQKEKRKLDKAISENPNMNPKFIVGSTDPTGSKEDNEAIALKRAEALKTYIEARCVETFGLKIVTQIETYRQGIYHSQNRVAILHYE